ncbi:MAG: YkgJ family cysteine cluster protein [Candidatus Thorarchaeota archaeon]|nr:YkgJ family cysteine cluster protein [Candidatus Thorarchaeota archaeon]
MLAPSEVHFECIRCGACCRQIEMIVTLTGRDITRIANGLGLTPKQMIRALDFYIPHNGDEIPPGLEHIPQVLTENGLATIALKKSEDGECLFLKDSLCMIHEIRPGACRSFPFVFDNSSEAISWGLSAMKRICPGLGNGAAVKESDIIDTATEVLEDLKIYREFTEEWNQSNITHTVSNLMTSINSDTRFLV